MKRIRKRVIGVVMGLALGWLAQGWMQDLFAQAQPPASTAEASSPALQGEDHAISHAGAEHLAPGPDGQRWMMGLGLSIAGLFALALIVGIPASRYAGQPAFESDHDDHASHGKLHRHTGSH
jgi:uncharacterized protein (DUF1501 family)